MLLTSSSMGRTWCPPLVSTKIAACFIGHTNNLSKLLGSNCTFSTGPGNLYFCSHSPDSIFQIQTVLSVEAEAILWPFLDQLILQTGCTWAVIILAIPLVKKSHITIRPSLHPTASKVPLLLNEHVPAKDKESRVPSNSYKKYFIEFL